MDMTPAEIAAEAADALLDEALYSEPTTGHGIDWADRKYPGMSRGEIHRMLQSEE